MSVGDPTPLWKYPAGTILPRLGPTVNQGSGYLHPGDIDDCAPVATGQAARAVGATMVTIPVFRKAAGVPDLPNHSDGMTKAEVLKGAIAVYGKQVRVVSAPIAWDDYTVNGSPRSGFMNRIKLGAVFSVAVSSKDLPLRLQYGFKGIHQISGRMSGKLYIINPLAPEGQGAQEITFAELKKAVMALGKVSAVLFYVAAPPPPPPAPEPPPPPAGDCFDQHDLNVAYATGYNESLDDAAKAIADIPRKVAQ